MELPFNAGSSARGRYWSRYEGAVIGALRCT